MTDEAVHTSACKSIPISSDSGSLDVPLMNIRSTVAKLRYSRGYNIISRTGRAKCDDERAHLAILSATVVSGDALPP